MMLYTNTTNVRLLQEKEQEYREKFDSLDDVLKMRYFIGDLESEVDEYRSIRKNTPRKLRAAIDNIFEDSIKFIKDYRGAARAHIKQTKKRFNDMYNMLRNFTQFTGEVDDLRRELDKTASTYSILCKFAHKRMSRKIKQYLKNKPYIERLKREMMAEQSISNKRISPMVIHQDGTKTVFPSLGNTPNTKGQFSLKRAITLYQEADRYNYFEAKQLLFPYQGPKQGNSRLLRLVVAGIAASAAGAGAYYICNCL
ncbi:hypothetical protein GF371_05505 [Candidatus Woesearchaeota archaeon]|nr:hypothetical protein [Candidatus Woesearchaeota archaeon]